MKDWRLNSRKTIFLKFLPILMGPVCVNGAGGADFTSFETPPGHEEAENALRKLPQREVSEAQVDENILWRMAHAQYESGRLSADVQERSGHLRLAEQLARRKLERWE